jgi:hypothetical protein
MKIGITGHQVIPPEADKYVRSGIADCLTRWADDLTGVGSLAAGADQLFAACLLHRGGKLHVIVPCDNYETTFSNESDLDRYVKFCNQAARIEKLPFPAPSEEAYLAAGKQVVDCTNLLLAVWDGEPARGKGGTADIVAYARQCGTEVQIIWPVGVKR